MEGWSTEKFLKDLETVVNMDSGSSDIEGISRVAGFFEAKFRELGWHIIRHENGGGAGMGLEISSRAQGGLYDVLLVGHMDTVFPKGTVAERPFRVENGCAYGPGVADMKGGLIEIYYLCKRLAAEGADLSIGVALNGDEETGSAFSEGWMKAMGRKARFCFVMEPGRPGGAFVKRRKGCMDVKLSFQGIPSHAGVAPEKGASAITELGHWIVELAGMNGYDKGISVNPGTVFGGTAPNVVAENAECMVDLRFKNAEDLEGIKQKFSQMAEKPFVKGVKTKVEYLGGFMPMILDERAQELIKLVDETAGCLGIPIHWVETGGASDANNISALGVPSICGCGPCGSGLHSSGEYLIIETIPQRLELLYHVIQQLNRAE